MTEATSYYLASTGNSRYGKSHLGHLVDRRYRMLGFTLCGKRTTAIDDELAVGQQLIVPCGGCRGHAAKAIQ